MFFIFMISEILLARFLSHDLRSFLSIRSMGLGTTTSLIIYLQPWSESMALAPSIWQISPIPLNLDSSSSSKLGREICGFEKKNSLRTCFLCWGDTCVQVSSNLVPHNSRIKVEKKVSGWTGYIPFFLDMSARDRTHPVQGQTCPLNNFCNNIWWLLWS
jgi:hypothetical protein